MDAVRDMTGPLAEQRRPLRELHQCAGRAARRRRAVRRASSPAPGDVVTVPAGVTIMDTLRAHGCRIASSCETGTCGTCRTRLLAGIADHRDLVLADDERADNIMVCVSRAKSGRAHARLVMARTTSTRRHRTWARVHANAADVRRAIRRMTLAGAADPRPEARHRFESDFGVRTHANDRSVVRRSVDSMRSMSRARTSSTASTRWQPPAPASMCWWKSRWRSRSPMAQTMIDAAQRARAST